MKCKLIVLSTISTLLLIVASCSSVVSVQSVIDEKVKTNNEDGALNQIKLELLESTKEKNTNTKWFPGFILVQIAKGILAFFLVLLILLDIIEPKNTTG